MASCVSAPATGVSQPNAAASIAIPESAIPLIAIGTALGLGAAYVLADLLASVLFGVEPRDAAVFTVVPLLLATVAAAAVSVPAHRASRVSPLDALRCE
jgi:ABC-type lipoprotein release transport system permease subunit